MSKRYSRYGSHPRGGGDGCNSHPQRLDSRNNTPAQSYDDGEWYDRGGGGDDRRG